MKKLVRSIILATALISASSLFADTYKASMTGVECNGCKKKIIQAIGAIEGVESAKFESEKEDGKFILTVQTKGASEITKEEATKVVAISEHYKLESWAKIDK